MRILLLDKATGLYFVRVGLWTEKPDEAHAFPTGAHVASQVVKHRLQYAAAVYWFGNPSESFSIAMHSFSKTA